MATNGAGSDQSTAQRWVPWVLMAGLTAFAVGGVFLPEGSVPWPECQVKKHSGLHCPGCGGTRAARSLATGDLLLAAKQNFMVFPVLIGSAWVALAFVVNRATGRQWWSPAKLGWRTMVALLVVLLIFTVIRNLEFGAFLRP